MSASYEEILDFVVGIKMAVSFVTVGRDVVDYSIVLLLAVDDTVETIRLYDGAHGVNELHRYGRAGGQQSGTIFHRGTLGEGMRTAIAEVVRGHQAMIEGWER